MFAKYLQSAGLLMALALASLLVAGCGERQAETASRSGSAEAAAQGRGSGTAAAQALLPADSWFAIDVGGHTLQLQLAVTQAEQAQGLMGRKSLAKDHGMLFVFDRGKKQSFWMANTPLPLDIGYFDNDGILREVYPLYPFDRTSVISQRSDIRYALEMTQGWFAQNGVRPGAKIDLQALDAALKQRRR